MIASRSSPWTRSRFLTKNRSSRSLVEEPGEFRGELGVLAEALAEAFLDPVPVLDAHRDHAERLVRPFPGMLEDRSTTASTSGAGLLVSAPGCQGAGTYRRTLLAAGAREGDQRPVVDVRVGEGDQPLVAASVVPEQQAEAEHRAERVEDRLEPARCLPSAAAGLSGSGWSASSSVLPETKNAVGGSCLSSPATTSCRPRRIEVTASAGVIWEASSKMTTSK